MGQARHAKWALLARPEGPGPIACSGKSLQLNERQDPPSLRADCTMMLPTLPRREGHGHKMVSSYEDIIWGVRILIKK